VYHYDRRGRGASGDTPPYEVAREIEDIEALIKEAGGSAFVFGMSSGGVLALDAAAWGLSILKLALYEPPFIVDGSRPPLPTDYVTHLKDLISSGHRGEAVEYSMTKAMGIPTEFVASMRNEPWWQAFEAVAHTLPYDGTIMGDTMSGNRLPAERWARINIPTLVINGGASDAFMRNGAQALADLLPDGQHRTLEGQSHDVDPLLLAPILKEFYGC
jgi:pimeloyl-ACP methyl ester carboxylesterase